jgi:hypothetical protein
MIVRTFRIDGNQRYSWTKNQRSLFVTGRDHAACASRHSTAACASRHSTDVDAPHSLLQVDSSTLKAKPRRPGRNRAARSFCQFRRFRHLINTDKVFGTHKGRESFEPKGSGRARWRPGRVQFGNFCIGEYAAARQKSHTFWRFRGKPGTASGHHVDDELRVLPVFEL